MDPATQGQLKAVAAVFSALAGVFGGFAASAGLPGALKAFEGVDSGSGSSSS